MAERELYCGIMRGPRRALLVYRQRLIKIANHQILVGIKQVNLRTIIGFCPQRRNLFERLVEFLPLAQYIDIIHVDAAIVRIEQQRGFKQKLRFVIGIKLGANFGQKAHRLDMMAFGLQKMAADIFGFDQPPLLN